VPGAVPLFPVHDTSMEMLRFGHVGGEHRLAGAVRLSRQFDARAKLGDRERTACGVLDVDTAAAEIARRVADDTLESVFSRSTTGQSLSATG
jgi:hypothetical protein